jgi:hypothetical protein
MTSTVMSKPAAAQKALDAPCQVGRTQRTRMSISPLRLVLARRGRALACIAA